MLQRLPTGLVLIAKKSENQSTAVQRLLFPTDTLSGMGFRDDSVTPGYSSTPAAHTLLWEV